MTAKHYRELVVWQKAMDLVQEVYEITRRFPKEEVFGLTSQVRRAAVSIRSNIAEGQSRGRREFIHFLSIAKGSLSEVETQIAIALRLGYVKAADTARLDGLAAEVGKLLNGLSRSIEKLATGHRQLATV